ncbi:MAG: glycosyltransferase family 2 protein [Verrucomicrobia bacterium]|nr:glycosyltransferase family 2 protein [Cytophagales bacterium]
MRHKISAVLITYNEAYIIEETLQVLDFCEEIIVVDSGSKDGTVAICEKFNARVFYKKFEGYGEQKQYAVAQAKNDWILAIDADEVVSQALKEEIIDVFSQENIAEHGFYLPRALIFQGENIYGERNDLQLRLFNKNEGNYDDAKVHEKVQIVGKTSTLKNYLWHYSYRNLTHYFEKFNYYTSLAAEELYAKGKKKPSWLLILRFPFDFLKIYLFKGCFRNGFSGFLWAFFSALYPMVKYAKVTELYKKNTIL